MTLLTPHLARSFYRRCMTVWTGQGNMLHAKLKLWSFRGGKHHLTTREMQAQFFYDVLDSCFLDNISARVNIALRAVAVTARRGKGRLLSVDLTFVMSLIHFFSSKYAVRKLCPHWLTQWASSIAMSPIRRLRKARSRADECTCSGAI